MNALLLNACPEHKGTEEQIITTSVDIIPSSIQLSKINLAEKNISPCSACMFCQIRHPGICVKKDDMEELLPRFIRSDVAIVITPVFCGGYSSTYKKFLDRLCPILTACFEKRAGETWHIPRYEKRPKMLGIGIVNSPGHEEKIFTNLFERNMKQMYIHEYSSLTLCKHNPSDYQKQLFSGLQKIGIKS